MGVRALGTGGWSCWRNSPSIGPYTPPEPTPGPDKPPPPTGLAAAAGDKSVTLTWDAPDITIAPISGYEYLPRAAGPRLGRLDGHPRQRPNNHVTHRYRAHQRR